MTLFGFGGSGKVASNLTSNYVFKPTPDQALRTNLAALRPARLNTALDFRSSGGSLESIT